MPYQPSGPMRTAMFGEAEARLRGGARGTGDGMKLYIAFLVSLLTFDVSRSGAMSHNIASVVLGAIVCFGGVQAV